MIVKSLEINKIKDIKNFFLFYGKNEGHKNQVIKFLLKESEEIFKYLTIDEKIFPVANKMFEHPEMDREYFEALTNKFRSPHIWKFTEGGWKLRHQVFVDSTEK